MLRYVVILTLLISSIAASQELQTYVFQGVHIIPMDTDQVIENQTIVVSGGRIEAIGSIGEILVPTNAILIEAEGQYIMPGLTEMHAHVPSADDPQYLEDVLFLYLANGVTTVRGMLGRPAHLTLRAQIARHEILGPRLLTSGPSLRGGRVDSPEHARQIVLEQSEAGYDFVKIHPGITLAQYNAAVQAANETGMPLAGHVPEDVGLARALSAGQASVDHMDGYPHYLVPPEIDLTAHQYGYYGMGLLDLFDENRIFQAAKETRDANVWVVPTQILFEQRISPIPARELATREDMAYMPPTMVQQWVQAKERLVSTINMPDGPSRLLEVRQRLIKALHDEGAGLLLGSDAPQVFNVPGFSIHHEIRAIMDAGLTSFEVLRTGTVASAEFLDAQEEFGKVSVGLAADLILVEADPLEDITTVSRPLGVMVRGLWLDRARLDEGLAAIAERQR